MSWHSPNNRGKSRKNSSRVAEKCWAQFAERHGRLFQAASIVLLTSSRPQLNPQRTAGHRNCLLWRPLTGLEASVLVAGAEALLTPDTTPLDDLVPTKSIFCSRKAPRCSCFGGGTRVVTPPFSMNFPSARFATAASKQPP
jgi:hypothetical protein